MLRFTRTLGIGFVNPQINSFLLNKAKYNMAKMIKLTPKASQSQSMTYDVQKTTKVMQGLFNRQDLINRQQYGSSQSSQSPVEKYMSLINRLNKKAVLQDYINGLNPEKALDLMNKIKNQRIMGSSIQVLIERKQFTQKERTYITNIMLLISQIIKKTLISNNGKSLDNNFLKEFIELFNQYFLLLSLNPRLVKNYIILTNHSIVYKIMDSSRAYFVNQKIVIDYILENKSTFYVGKWDLINILSYLSLAGVISNYFSRFYELVEFLLSKMSSEWHKDVGEKPKKYITSLLQLNYNCRKITDGFKQLILRPVDASSIQTVTLALNGYLNTTSQVFIDKAVPDYIIRPIKNIAAYLKARSQQNQSINLGTKDTKFTTKDNTKDSKSTKDVELQVYKVLIPALYRSSIWVEELWLEFANWLDKGKNYEKLPVITLYTVFELMDIDKDIIPSSIIERFKKSREHLLMKNNFRLEDVDLVKTYHQDYGSSMRAHYTLQQQITNNLRSVSKTVVKSQVLVRLFLVDILIDDKLIIEVNNQNHYIESQQGNGKRLNLKSRFRKRILEKLGYKCLQVEVDLFIEGNYEFLKLIKAIIADLKKNT